MLVCFRCCNGMATRAGARRNSPLSTVEWWSSEKSVGSNGAEYVSNLRGMSQNSIGSDHSDNADIIDVLKFGSSHQIVGNWNMKMVCICDWVCVCACVFGPEKKLVRMPTWHIRIYSNSNIRTLSFTRILVTCLLSLLRSLVRIWFSSSLLGHLYSS